MKPKDLKHSYSFKDRKVLLRDGILFVPNYYDNYEEWTFPGWFEFFNNNNPVIVEYCSGNGDWIVNRALKLPQKNFVAIEKRFDRVRKIWSKTNNNQLKNLFIICGEGNITTEKYFPANSVAEVFVNFPDPWPKKRHIKHRIIKQTFLNNVHKILIAKGSITLVTDDINYSEIMIEELQKHKGFKPLYKAPFFIENIEGYGTSYFEKLWKKLGRNIRFITFQKIKN